MDIQAPDVAWNEPFKTKGTEKCDAWMADGAHSFTAAGNMRSPRCCKIVKWVLEAWETVDREIIIGSFGSCMLTAAPDRSDPPLGNESGHDRLASIQQALTASCVTDPFAVVMLLNVKDAESESLPIELSHNNIEVDLEL